jgi:hypothetical protein
LYALGDLTIDPDEEIEDQMGPSLPSQGPTATVAVNETITQPPTPGTKESTVQPAVATVPPTKPDICLQEYRELTVKVRSQK